MRRVMLVITSVFLLLAATGCQRMVEVRTGVRVECPYGHVDSSDVQVIKVASKVASAYRVTTEKRVCDRHQALEGLYAQAQSALASGDLKVAQAKLSQITEQDGAFRKAAGQLSAIKEGRRPEPDTGGTPSIPATSTPKPGEGDTSSPVGSLKKYVPDTLTGFTGRPLITEPLAITRQYDPTGGSKVALLTIVAEQFRSAAESDRELTTHMARYPKGADTVTEGSRTLRYGSDGRRFVTAAFTNGAVLVILELGVKPDADPDKLKGTVLDAAGALP